MSIYLIGGPPKCGKTTLAKRLSKELNVPWISTDTLQNIVWAYTPKQEHAKLFPHSHLRGDSNDDFYSAHTSKEIVEGYIAQGKTTYDAIEMLAETYITDKDDFIVEGYSVTPELVKKISKRFGTEHIKVVFLVKNDEQKMITDFHKSTTPNDWILRKTKEEATYQKIAKMISDYSKYFEKEAKQYNLQYFAMDTNFEERLQRIISEFA
ncbi:MAG: AAA family ATPase [Candidatus Andersenbacteria bacterium]